MINGVRNSNGGKIIGGSGGEATTIVVEEHAYNFSLMATCGLDGHKYKPQLNYAWENLDSGLFLAKSTTLDDYWVSATKKVTHTKDSFYEFSKWIIQAVQSRGAKGTIMWIADGHICRLSLRTVRWLKKNDVEYFSCHCTSPPLTRPSTSCSRGGTILTAVRSSSTS